MPLRPDIAVTDDRSLQTYLEADPGTEAEATALARLMEEAAPTVLRLVRRRFRSARDPDAEEIISEARLQLVRAFRRLRAESLTQGRRADFDLSAYAATVTYTAWADSLRRRHPARAMLLNRLRYLLENRAGPRGFALWRGADNERLAGFAAWQSESKPAIPTPRHQWLQADPLAAGADAFSGTNGVPDDLAALVAGLLDWLGGPVELHDLTDALIPLCGLDERPTAPDEPEDTTPDPTPSPFEALRWKEYLIWLWQQVAGLPLRQRTAFLCHSSLLREMELCGLVSIRTAALALEIAPEAMATLWPRLPLPDHDIAALLGDGSRQQVINLRKVARATLGQAWREAQKEKRSVCSGIPAAIPR